MLTFDSDDRVEGITNNCFSAECRAVYYLFPEKLWGGFTKSLIDILQQIKSVYKLRENYETNTRNIT